MAKKNVFISRRWDYKEDYERINAVLDRPKYDVSDRLVESSDPLVGIKKEVTDAIKGKIDSVSPHVRQRLQEEAWGAKKLIIQ